VSVEEVSREVYQELQESGRISLMKTQNLIWIHEYYEEFKEWPTTGELEDWINEEQSATILDEVGHSHAHIGANQIRPRVTEDLHGKLEVVEKLEKREQDSDHRTKRAHPYRILYDRVEQELGIDLRSEESIQDGDEDLDIRKVGDHYEDQYGNKYLLDSTKNPDDGDEKSDSLVSNQAVDGDSQNCSTTDEDEEDDGDDDATQKVLMQDGEVVG
jgi:hypothetical protein